MRRGRYGIPLRSLGAQVAFKLATWETDDEREMPAVGAVVLIAREYKEALKSLDPSRDDIVGMALQFYDDEDIEPALESIGNYKEFLQGGLDSLSAVFNDEVKAVQRELFR